MRYDAHIYFINRIYCCGLSLPCLERCQKMGLDNDCHDPHSDDFKNFQNQMIFFQTISGGVFPRFLFFIVTIWKIFDDSPEKTLFSTDYLKNRFCYFFYGRAQAF